MGKPLMKLELGSVFAGLVLLCPLAAALQTAAWGTELSGTVSLFRKNEYEQMEYDSGKTATRCEHMVDKVGLLGGTRINFMVTHFFVDRNSDMVPQYYCYKPNTTEKCELFTPAYIAEWTTAFTKCLKYAVKKGFTGIAFTPHMDDGQNTGQWRNSMLINPIAKYGGMSYTDIMLLPLARVMSTVMNQDLTVWFALQGEMSLMITKFPQQHEQLLPFLKSIMINNDYSLAPKVRMGVSSNYNKLCGRRECILSEVQSPIGFDAAAVKRLYDAIDFVGMSAYPHYDQVDLLSLETATQSLDRELQMFGINLTDLINVKKKELVFNEFGVGGGATGSGDRPARTAKEVSRSPFYGVFGPYTRGLDPWMSCLPPVVVSETKQYLEDFYRATSHWLSRKGGPTWRVDAVFMWNLNSWDVTGIHPQSSNKEGSYKNEVVFDVIRYHNIRSRGAGSVWNPGSIPPY